MPTVQKLCQCGADVRVGKDDRRASINTKRQQTRSRSPFPKVFPATSPQDVQIFVAELPKGDNASAVSPDYRLESSGWRQWEGRARSLSQFCLFLHKHGHTHCLEEANLIEMQYFDFISEFYQMDMYWF